MRYFKITLSGAALFLIYLWITVMLNSCNGNKPEVQASQEEVQLLDDELPGSDFTEFEGESDQPENSTEDFENPSSDEEVQETFEEDDSYVAGDYTSKEKTSLKPRTKREVTQPAANTKDNEKTFTSKPASKATSTRSSGNYMVIAGSYLLEENAKKMVRKLQGMGYSNAEIVHFDQSQYHSICAGRYNSSNSASQTSSSLKIAGIDSYVHRRQ